MDYMISSETITSPEAKWAIPFFVSPPVWMALDFQPDFFIFNEMYKMGMVLAEYLAHNLNFYLLHKNQYPGF